MITAYEKIKIRIKLGEFELYIWDNVMEKELVALVTPGLDTTKPIFTHIYSECLINEIFYHKGYDYGEQGNISLQIIRRSNNGIFIFDRQEEIGISLFHEIEALKHQKRRLKKFTTNNGISFSDCERKYKTVIAILRFFNIKEINLLTNSKEKMDFLIKHGIKIRKRIPIVLKHNDENYQPLLSKNKRSLNFSGDYSMCGSFKKNNFSYLFESKTRLSKALRFLKRNIEYYNNLLPRYKDINHDNAVVLLESLPLTNNTLINKNYMSFLNNSITEKNKKLIESYINSDMDFIKEDTIQLIDYQNIYAEKTSGSTGIPLICLKDNVDRFKLGRCIWNLRRNIDSSITVNDLFLFIHEKVNQFPFGVITNKNVRIHKELEFLSKMKYSWWHGATFIFDEYVDFLLKNKEHEIPFVNFIENNGTFISNEQKQVYEILFNCQVVNFYGCREIWTIAYDCLHGYLHVDHKNVFLEIVDDKGNIVREPNKCGHIYITSLNQKVMPFTRYSTGDLGYYLEGECECGSQLPRIELLPGRQAHRIFGNEKLFGTAVFSDVVRVLNDHYNIYKFKKIRVFQIKEKLFEVFVYGMNEDRNLFESLFQRISKKYLTSNYVYKFTYNNDSVQDTIDKNYIFLSRLMR